MGSINRSKFPQPKLIREIYEGEVYEYYALGQHVVAAPGVCGGRPTFKYTRLEVSVILSLLAAGESVEQVVEAYPLNNVTPDTVAEAIRLADQALVQSVQTLQLAA